VASTLYKAYRGITVFYVYFYVCFLFLFYVYFLFIYTLRAGLWQQLSAVHALHGEHWQATGGTAGRVHCCLQGQQHSSSTVPGVPSWWQGMVNHRCLSPNAVLDMSALPDGAPTDAMRLMQPMQQPAAVRQGRAPRLS
jgi:hypothetical protein